MIIRQAPRKVTVKKCGFGYLSRQPNRLNGGNSDNGGLANVNANHVDNRNDNTGFSPLIVSYSLTVLIHPPSILPISRHCETICWYLLLSIHLVSLANRRSIFNKSNLILTFCKLGSFCSRGKYPATITSSIISRIIWSIFWPKVCRLPLGKVVTYWLKSL